MIFWLKVDNHQMFMKSDTKIIHIQVL